jgi:sigma-E factor negative regulatory protein RseA
VKRKVMQMDKTNTQELVSALADGQLAGDELARALQTATRDPGALEAWTTYHLIGDVLRSGELAQSTPSKQFLSRLQEGLRAEPPQAAALPPIHVREPVAAVGDRTRPAANEQRWKLVAGLASVAAVAAIGWTVAGAGGDAGRGAAQLAANPAPNVVLTSGERGTMLRDERLDQLLAAHRQLGSAAALQAPNGFLRNATFEPAGR